MPVLPQHLKPRSKESPRGKKRGKKHHLATTMSFGGLSDKAVTPSREITRSFCSYSEMWPYGCNKCRTEMWRLDGSAERIPKTTHEDSQSPCFGSVLTTLSLPLNSRLDSNRRPFTSTSGCGHRGLRTVIPVDVCPNLSRLSIPYTILTFH